MRRGAQRPGRSRWPLDGKIGTGLQGECFGEFGQRGAFEVVEDGVEVVLAPEQLVAAVDLLVRYLL